MLSKQSARLRHTPTALCTAAFIASLFLLNHCRSKPATRTPQAQTPKRLMILVFDQLRYDYIDRFNLTHFKRIMGEGVAFPSAYVGHLSSNTVVSHPVITTGYFPKNLPWQDYVIKDTKGVLGKKNRYYDLNRLGPQKWLQLLKAGSNADLIRRVKAQFGGKCYSVAQKGYSAFSFGGPNCDSIITFGKVGNRQYPPTGINVPRYITLPQGNAFYLPLLPPTHKSLKDHIGGIRYYAGNDPNHPGGDAWVGNVIRTIMSKDPRWGIMLGSFGAIDKIGHALGEQEGATRPAWAVKHSVSLENTLREADKQLGLILDALDKSNTRQQTLLVITADHGAQANQPLYGKVAGKSRGITTYGSGANFKRLTPPKELTGLLARKEVQVSRHDTGLRFWLKRPDFATISQFARRLRSAPGVAEIYTKQQTGRRNHYLLAHRSTELVGKAKDWAESKHASLLATIDSDAGPDVVAFLLDGHGYGAPGAHGGGQENVQRIPLILSAANLQPATLSPEAEARLVDIYPMVGRIMGLSLPDRDGTAEPLNQLPQYQAR